MAAEAVCCVYMERQEYKTDLDLTHIYKSNLD